MFKIILLMFFILTGCSTTTNNFSSQENAFLNSINSRSFNGVGVYQGQRFSSSTSIIITSGSEPAGSEFKNRRSLQFLTTRNNGQSATEAIYRQNLTPDIPTFPAPPAGETVRIFGIVRDPDTTKLSRTAFIDEATYANNPENLNWTSLTDFATR